MLSLVRGGVCARHAVCSLVLGVISEGRCARHAVVSGGGGEVC